uniref:Transmembrane protein n=1 Tax=Trypanosoma congolense (strain IL3000) TaxID=1068625 RepID=G0URD8_TRYCI|nr:conserved hypothetical protein [Trypanosoma congolense IL3000]
MSARIGTVALARRQHPFYWAFPPLLHGGACRLLCTWGPRDTVLQPAVASLGACAHPLTHQKRHQHRRHLLSQSQSLSYHHHHQHHSQQQNQNPKQQQQRWFKRFCPLRTWWRWFRQQSLGRKCVTLVAAVFAGLCGYVALCLAVWWRQQSVVDGLFSPAEDHPLEDWALVEPTLREGDIVLMMGTGSVSAMITAAQFLYSGMHASALCYSHVAVVVEPVQYDRWRLRRRSPSLGCIDGDSGASGGTVEMTDAERGLLMAKPFPTGLLTEEQFLPGRRPKRGAVIMEAIDNTDVNAVDVNGVVRHGCVQLVEASRRVFGRRDGRWCYRRFAVRRLKGFEWTPHRKRLLRDFINENVGRPLDTNNALVLSYIHPRLYEWLGGRPRGTEVSCGELIVDLYKYCGVIRRRVRPAATNGDAVGNAPSTSLAAALLPASSGPDPGGDKDLERESVEEYYARPSITTAPYQFAEGEEVGVLDFAEGISLGPEVRLNHPYTSHQHQ